MEDSANRDDLTQLQNRRFFYHRLQEELARAEKTEALSVVMIDVDDLKLLNDEFGHPVGDLISATLRVLNWQAGPITSRTTGRRRVRGDPPRDGRRNAEQFGWRLWDELAAANPRERDRKHLPGYLSGRRRLPPGGTDLEEIIHWADTKLSPTSWSVGLQEATDTKADTRPLRPSSRCFRPPWTSETG
jgi:predicted signal transduction protein with EAL and GGDEF domain